MKVRLLVASEGLPPGREVSTPDCWKLCLPDDAYVVRAVAIDAEAKEAVEAALLNLPDHKQANARRRMERHAARLSNPPVSTGVRIPPPAVESDDKPLPYDNPDFDHAMSQEG